VVAVVEVVAFFALIAFLRIGTDWQFRRNNCKRSPDELLRAPATVNRRVGVVRVLRSALIFEPKRKRDAVMALPFADITHVGIAPGNTPWLVKVARLTIASADGRETRMTVTGPSAAVLNALQSAGAATP
jgi:hypothetical protein